MMNELISMMKETLKNQVKHANLNDHLIETLISDRYLYFTYSLVNILLLSLIMILVN